MLTRLAALALVLSPACVSGGAVAADADQPPQGGATMTYDGLPVGAPTTLPWWQRGRLHLGETVIPTRLSDVASRNGTTVVGAGEDQRLGGPTTWFLVDGERLARLPTETPADQPLISADGRWLAWQEVRARRTEGYRRVERFRVVVYDVERQAIANSFRDRRRVAWEDGINAIWLRTLSNEGRLVLSRGSDGVQVLSPRGRPVGFGGPQVDHDRIDGWPGGTTVLRPRSGASVYGQVGEDGSFEPTGRFTVSSSGLWAADGGGYAYTDDDAEPLTHWARSLVGGTVRLGVPVDVPELRIVGWESADTVVLWQFDDYSREPASRLVRCSTTTGSCERVPGGPRPGAHASMPSLW